MSAIGSILGDWRNMQDYPDERVMVYITDLHLVAKEIDRLNGIIKGQIAENNDLAHQLHLESSAKTQRYRDISERRKDW